MADKKFQVIINGQLVDGAELIQTRQNIARLFKTTIEAVEPMFSGKRVSVKKNLDQVTAKKYQQIIIKAGLKAGVIPMARTASAEKTIAAPRPQTTTLDDATIAAVGSTIDDRRATPKATIDTSAYRMDDVGITLDETAPPPAANIDTSAYAMDEVGTILDESPPAAAAEIDVSDISMRAAGEDLMEYKPPPEIQFDISQLSMGEAGEEIMEYAPVAPADIDTSKLNLVKE